ncbi:MAG: HAD-IC family P-type ATPase, partial [Patescibacteria group bacterium]
FGMKDALRPEVSGAMSRAINAGVRVIMITGDHRITAKTIAKEAGIYKAGDEIITGNELEGMSDEELAERISRVSVFDRVSPEHKLRIIKAFKATKKIVAMTGDGVNDAPSLVSADLGVAMGKIGTEVAKEASDIVLLDDNFGSIISAIEEGRSIYKTIKKVILYLFSTNFGEVLTIAGALFLGFPLPILPVQIIWLNLVTDGFLDVALAMEPREKNLLLEKFKKPNKYLFDFLMGQRMFLMALSMMLGTLFIFKGLFQADLVKAQTMSLVVLAVFQWFNAWNCRSEDKSIFRSNPLSNRFLAAATIIVVLLQLLAVYSPVMQKILHTSPLSGYDWLLAIAVASSIIAIEETRKFFYRFWKRHGIFGLKHSLTVALIAVCVLWYNSGII